MRGGFVLPSGEWEWDFVEVWPVGANQPESRQYYFHLSDNPDSIMRLKAPGGAEIDEETLRMGGARANRCVNVSGGFLPLLV
jgi:hypothetical protein